MKKNKKHPNFEVVGALVNPLFLQQKQKLVRVENSRIELNIKDFRLWCFTFEAGWRCLSYCQKGLGQSIHIFLLLNNLLFSVDLTNKISMKHFVMCGGWP